MPRTSADSRDLEALSCLSVAGMGPTYVRLATVVVEMLDPKNPHPGVFWLEEGVDGLGDEQRPLTAGVPSRCIATSSHT